MYVFSHLSRYVVFFALGIVALCPLSLTLQLIGLCGAHRWETTHTYLQPCIIRSKKGSRGTSHTIKSRCACVWKTWDIVDGGNGRCKWLWCHEYDGNHESLILLLLLEDTYLSFESEDIGRTWVAHNLSLSLFLLGHLSSLFISFIHSFFLSFFQWAPMLLWIYWWEVVTRIFGALFGWEWDDGWKICFWCSLLV